MRWQEFEEEVRKICEAHDFTTKFRYVFKDEEGKSEIDVVAERYGTVLCFDAKLYSASRYRVSQLKKEAEKHRERVERFSTVTGKKAVPVIVSFIDDLIRFHAGCIVVPYSSLNEFLGNLHYYLSEFGFL
uniref:Restriction endonuclease type IV Mrr domain-containing protein n=1 Tax=Archaeoglobus fulgidus TaxID=2234 RepID=A0A7C3RER1_ARCFL